MPEINTATLISLRNTDRINVYNKYKDQLSTEEAAAVVDEKYCGMIIAGTEVFFIDRSDTNNTYPNPNMGKGKKTK